MHAAEPILEVEWEGSRLFSEKFKAFCQTLSFTISKWRQHLFSFEGCRKKHDTELRDEMVALKMKHISISYGIEGGAEELHVYCTKDENEICRN